MTPCENYSAGIIARTNGQPYATRNAAAQQMSAKGLNDTHEVIENGDGYAIAPKQREPGQEERVTLKPGDYVSTEGMDEATYHKVAEALMAAGAEEIGTLHGFQKIKRCGFDDFGWNAEDNSIRCSGSFDSLMGEYGFSSRHLTIAQVLNAANAQPADADGWIEWHGGECPVERGTLVDVRRRDGEHGTALHARMDTYEEYSEGDATAEDWSNDGVGGDIIAYRLHKPEHVEQSEPVEYNYRMSRGASDAETIRLNGWKEGDVIEGVEGSKTDRIMITRIGESRFLGRWDYGCKGIFDDERGNITLSCREWRLVEKQESVMSLIDTLRIAKRERDEAKATLEQKEAVLVEAMDAVRAELGNGFELSETGEVRDLPPEEWREGDLVECVDDGPEYCHKGGIYMVNRGKEGASLSIKADDDGDEGLPPIASFRFNSRPTA